MAELNEIIIVQGNDPLLNFFNERLYATKWNVHRNQPSTIFRVPKEIREVEPNAYEPFMVALGPYNHGKSSLSNMEGVKWRYLEKFLSRNKKKQLKDYMDKVRELEPKARAAYSEPSEMTSNEFVEMMLLDCCFVLEILRIKYPSSKGENNAELEYLKNNGELWAIDLSLHDMLVAENQLPFFLLDELSNLNDYYKSFNLRVIAVTHVITSFPALCPGEYTPEKFLKKLEEYQIQDFHHFLHLLYVLLTKDIEEKYPQTDKQSSNDSDTMHSTLNGKRRENGSSLTQASPTSDEKMEKFIEFIFSSFYNKPRSFLEIERIPLPWARKLKEAGVVFKRNQKASTILDITFDKGIMSIPKLQFFDETSYILRNLIVFEQFFDGVKNHVGNYVDFMDSLMDTAEDVAELQEDGIVVNGVGSNETIALLLNRMCKRVKVGAGMSTSYLRPVCSEVVKYANKRRNRWREKLNHDYFSNPWSLISFLAALTLLLLTLTQTVFAVVAYAVPPN